jgi:hypothetical protein
MPLADPGHRPMLAALDNVKRCARLQRPLEEVAVGGGQAAELQAVVRHGVQHQPVLVRVMHVVHDHVRIAGSESLGHRSSDLERPLRIVRVDADLTDRTEIGLRQPWYAECRGEMDDAAVRRANEGRRIPLLREETRDPRRDRLRSHLVSPMARDRLSEGSDRVCGVARLRGQPVRQRHEPVQDGRLAWAVERLPAQAQGQRLHHSSS